MRFLICSLFLAAGMAAQQPNTVTANVSVTRTITGGAASYQIQFLDTTLASSVDSALAALGAVGVTASHLAGVSVAINQGYLVTTYSFEMPVAGGQFNDTRDKLLALQRTLVNSQTQALGWSGKQVPSSDDIASAVDQALPDLMILARQRATAMARVMNSTLGAVAALQAPTIIPNGPSVTFVLAVTYAVTPQ